MIGALTLLGLFLFCVARQMNVRVAERARTKVILITSAKYVTGAVAGYLFGLIWDPVHEALGLSARTVVAAMTTTAMTACARR